MEMQGSQEIPADRDTVWRGLNDPETLRRAIPGCESLTGSPEQGFEAVAVASVGPVKAKFKGKVTLNDVKPPDSYVLTGEGQGGVAGFARGSARVRLEPKDAQMTVLHYAVTAQVGGKLAQIGQRLVDAAARKMADDFFKAFAAELRPAAASEAAQSPARTPEEPGGGVPAWLWVPLLILGATALTLLFAWL